METAQCLGAALPQAQRCRGRKEGSAVVMTFDAWVGVAYTGPMGQG